MKSFIQGYIKDSGTEDGERMADWNDEDEGEEGEEEDKEEVEKEYENNKNY